MLFKMFKHLFKIVNLYIILQINLTIMYYEEAKVKEYHRKNKEGVKKPYYQINLPIKSKFSEVKPIALVDIAELKKLETFLEDNPIEEKEAKINELEAEVSSLKEQLKEFNQLKEDKVRLQEELLEAKTKLEIKSEELSKEKDLTKTLLVVRSDFLKQNAFKRLFKVEPESSKIVGKLKELPEEVEAKLSEDQQR